MWQQLRTQTDFNEIKNSATKLQNKTQLQSTLIRLFQAFLILYQQLFNSSFYKRNETNGGRNHIAEGIWQHPLGYPLEGGLGVRGIWPIALSRCKPLWKAGPHFHMEKKQPKKKKTFRKKAAFNKIPNVFFLQTNYFERWAKNKTRHAEYIWIAHINKAPYPSRP